MEKSTHDAHLSEKILTGVIVAGILGYWAYILLGNGLS